MEVQPTPLIVLTIWLPAAIAAATTLLWAVRRDGERPAAAGAVTRWMGRTAVAAVAVLLAGLSVLAVIVAVHEHADREAVNDRVEGRE